MAKFLMKKVTLLVAGLLLSTAALCGAREMTFLVPDFKPYTYLDEQDQLVGIGVEQVSAILRQAGIDYQLRPVANYGVAVEQIRQGQADGFFLASESTERNHIASLSEPVIQNRWSWFLPPDSDWQPNHSSATGITVATFLNTNTHRWLQQHRYQVIGVSNETQTLPLLLLQYKRVDAVFVAEPVFVTAARELGYQHAEYRQIVQSVKPMGIYVAHHSLREQPELMAKLNAAIAKLASVKKP